MAGRHALPIAVLQARGKKHLTKKEIAERQKAEVLLGSDDLKKLAPPPFIINDLVAYGYWKKHINEYQRAADNGQEILKSSDAGLLAMYCKMQSEYEALMEFRDRKQAGEGVFIIDDILKLEAAINKKVSALIQMQDRLFLNPLAKAKNVLKKDKPPPANPMDEFGV